MRNLHLLKQTFSQARQTSGTHQFNGPWPPLTTKARKKQEIPADVESLDDDLKAVLTAQIDVIEERIKSVIAYVETFAIKAGLLQSIPGIGPVSAAILIAGLPELGRMTAGEAAAMTGLAPVPRDSGMMRGRRTIAGGSDLFGMCCTRLHLPPTITTQF